MNSFFKQLALLLEILADHLAHLLRELQDRVASAERLRKRQSR